MHQTFKSNHPSDGSLSQLDLAWLDFQEVCILLYWNSKHRLTLRQTLPTQQLQQEPPRTLWEEWGRGLVWVCWTIFLLLLVLVLVLLRGGHKASTIITIIFRRQFSTIKIPIYLLLIPITLWITVSTTAPHPPPHPHPLRCHPKSISRVIY